MEWMCMRDVCRSCKSFLDTLSQFMSTALWEISNYSQIQDRTDGLYVYHPASFNEKIGEHKQCNTQYHYNMEVLKIKAVKANPKIKKI